MTVTIPTIAGWDEEEYEIPLTPGTYYIRTVADCSHWVGESSETNNTLTGAPILLDQAAPLVAASDPSATQIGGGSTLTTASLDPIVQEAIKRWDEALHLTQTQMDLLKQVNFQIADLSGLTLGLTSGSMITLDSEAAGYGWFIDSTPSTDTEFRRHQGKTDLFAKPGSIAAEDMDLLSVVTHELGHVLGYDHLIDSSEVSIMDTTLDAGERLLPSPAKKAKRSAKPAKAQQHQALVFDEKSGELRNASKKDQRGKLVPNAIQFEPVWAGSGKSRDEEKEGWIVEL
jgi:hypothetical protein